MQVWRLFGTMILFLERIWVVRSAKLKGTLTRTGLQWTASSLQIRMRSVFLEVIIFILLNWLRIISKVSLVWVWRWSMLLRLMELLVSLLRLCLRKSERVRWFQVRYGWKLERWLISLIVMSRLSGWRYILIARGMGLLF